jgi:acylphosphatase
VSRIARRLLISGRVQGVGFRDFVRRTATALGLSGWVRNLRDGRVEALVEGEEASVATLLERCRCGPGRVDDVATEAAPTEARTGFEVRHTGSLGP